MLNTRNQQVIEPKLPFLCLSCVHMTKRSMSKPGSPAKPISTEAARVQENAFESHTMEQDMNKPFLLALSVSRNAELSAAFLPPMVIEAGIFRGNRDNEIVHTTIVNKLTDVTCNAMDPHFTVTVKIQNAICLIVESNHKRDATGTEFFCFLTSQHQCSHCICHRLSTMPPFWFPFWSFHLGVSLQ